MGKTTRTIQGYIRSLGEKGLLHIHTQYSAHGRQHTNRYDVRPFFAAIEGLARLDGLLDGVHRSDDAGAGEQPSLHPTRSAAPPEPPTENARPTRPGARPAAPHNTDSARAEQDPLCAVAARGGAGATATHDAALTGREGEESCAGGVKNSSPQVNPVEIDPFDLDSMPPTPIGASLDGTYHERLPQPTGNADDQALAAKIATLSAALGDDAPRSSLSRARNLHRDAGVSLDRFLRLLDEAATRTRDRQASIVKRRRDGQAPNGMPYLFAVLQDLLHPAPPRAADVGPPPDRRHTSPSRRHRRPREGDCGEISTPYAAWSDSPAPLPIVEEHPVWRAALAELAQVMTSENFNAWLASTRALDQDGEVLRIAVPAAFNKTWLEQKLAGKVMAALQKIDYDALGAGRIARVEYVVEPAACVPTEATAQAS